MAGSPPTDAPCTGPLRLELDVQDAVRPAASISSAQTQPRDLLDTPMRTRTTWTSQSDRKPAAKSVGVAKVPARKALQHASAARRASGGQAERRVLVGNEEKRVRDDTLAPP